MRYYVASYSSVNNYHQHKMFHVMKRRLKVQFLLSAMSDEII
jgi:hypothetical protein